MTSKHTPKPWRVTHFGGSRAGHRIVAPTVEIDAGVGRHSAIATMHMRADGANTENVMTNAKLIAAAPDLYETLRDLVEHADRECWQRHAPLLENAVKALAKAGL